MVKPTLMTSVCQIGQPMICLIYTSGAPLLSGSTLVGITIVRNISVQLSHAFATDKIMSDASGNNDAKHAVAERR